MTDRYVQATMDVLGAARDVFSGHDTWRPLEEAIDAQLPDDYKALIDAYGPVQVNGHLYLEHPANPFYPLRTWISETIEDFRDVDWGEEDSPQFGGKAGLIPIASTDRGEYAFLAPGNDGGQSRIFSCGRDEPDLYEHRMTFAEWLYRYLAGEEMFSPGHRDFYPGPVRLESLPTAAGDRSSKWYGQERST
ncbi:SMI1/KNR4 family protein [Streptomyces flavotricini]|uniref:SMI1/KNR4 family protein n=1 Tax=Streptomyces flavotricini TaxID=66888 RepID=A0ABS8DWP5_9ACTN|nr:SMI1/KNR4 family protein [Streptomyces flavotricini]MCC0093230.1 SMI1/KNR4 family protein [Streptomyces flavotricini]